MIRNSSNLIFKKGKYMKNLILAAIAAFGLVATPTLARDFTGPRLEVTAGADDVTNGVDATNVAYGAALGYDRQFGRVVVGVDATAANVFDRADLGLGARAGVVANENVLLFGRVGYSNLNRRLGANLDGVTVGGGLEVNVLGSAYVKAEYRYTDFNRGVGRHGGLVGVGMRF